MILYMSVGFLAGLLIALFFVNKGPKGNDMNPENPWL